MIPMVNKNSPIINPIELNLSCVFIYPANVILFLPLLSLLYRVSKIYY